MVWKNRKILLLVRRDDLLSISVIKINDFWYVRIPSEDLLDIAISACPSVTTQVPVTISERLNECW
jgi:hypothetical protein